MKKKIRGHFNRSHMNHVPGCPLKFIVTDVIKIIFFSPPLIWIGSHRKKKTSEWSSSVFDNDTKSKSCQTLQYLIQHAKRAGSNLTEKTVYELKWFYFMINKISLLQSLLFPSKTYFAGQTGPMFWSGLSNEGYSPVPKSSHLTSTLNF